MYNSQFNYDMAEEPTDPRHEIEERIGELLDEGDDATTLAFAEFAYDRIGHEEVVIAMAALFRGTQPGIRHIRQRASEDAVSEPLDCLRICMDEHREDFIKHHAEQTMEASREAASDPY